MDDLLGVQGIAADPAAIGVDRDRVSFDVFLQCLDAVGAVLVDSHECILADPVARQPVEEGVALGIRRFTAVAVAVASDIDVVVVVVAVVGIAVAAAALRIVIVRFVRHEKGQIERPDVGASVPPGIALGGPDLFHQQGLLLLAIHGDPDVQDVCGHRGASPLAILLAPVDTVAGVGPAPLGIDNGQAVALFDLCRVAGGAVGTGNRVEFLADPLDFQVALGVGIGASQLVTPRVFFAALGQEGLPLDGWFLFELARGRLRRRFWLGVWLGSCLCCFWWRPRRGVVSLPRRCRGVVLDRVVWVRGLGVGSRIGIDIDIDVDIVIVMGKIDVSSIIIAEPLPFVGILPWL
mmetsp:Transcript_7649/g.22408  ORF Transcript_7649/g.22408 Transcript_7649/m.22408 type:complete len:349 (+) Transcript_7649:1906-2952(+)